MLEHMTGDIASLLSVAAILAGMAAGLIYRKIKGGT